MGPRAASSTSPVARFDGRPHSPPHTWACPHRHMRTETHGDVDLYTLTRSNPREPEPSRNGWLATDDPREGDPVVCRPRDTAPARAAESSPREPAASPPRPSPAGWGRCGPAAAGADRGARQSWHPTLDTPGTMRGQGGRGQGIEDAEGGTRPRRVSARMQWMIRHNEVWIWRCKGGGT